MNFKKFVRKVIETRDFGFVVVVTNMYHTKVYLFRVFNSTRSLE